VLIDLLTIFFTSLTYLFFLRKVAKNIGLVDRPNARKKHSGVIPLIGGISICLVILNYLYFKPESLPHAPTYMACISLLTILGALDDKYDVSFKIRFLVQAALSIAMMNFADLVLENLGDMLAVGDLHLGSLGYVITTLAVIGAINAYNMVDGIDGLLGGLSTVTFASLGFIFLLSGNQALAFFCLILCVAIAPYILLNLGAFGRARKVFMGDAGSMLIGFTVIWLLLLASQQDSNPPLRPVTALWLIAIPLMDMTAVMIRRIKRGNSPFKPDREHLHHIFQRVGLNSAQTLAVICLSAVTLSTIGILGDLFNVPEYIMLAGFILCFGTYLLVLRHAWKITSGIKLLFKLK